MSWRVVIISRRCKLEYKLGYLICRGEDTKKIFIKEISTLIIESIAVSLTSALICELNKQKISIIFCDEKHNPHSQLLSLYGRYNCSGMLRSQLKWGDEIKKKVWTEIIRLKIKKQYELLLERDIRQSDLLMLYLKDIKEGDETNREGHAAKVYFNALFGIEFKRSDTSLINAALNYGYSVILATFNRAIVACGFNTQLGIAHKNEYNDFNLSCDLMEPFRSVVDRYIISHKSDEFDINYKHDLCNILNHNTLMDGERHPLVDAVSIYVKSVFNALEENDISLIKEYEF